MRRLALLASVLVLFCAAAAAQAAQDSPLPFVRLYQSARAAGKVLPEVPAEGWRAVPEGTAGADFPLPLAAFNDGVGAVLGGERGVALYARGADGWTRRAVLVAVGEGGAVLKRIVNVEVARNDSGATHLRVAFAGVEGVTARAVLKIAAAEPMVTLEGGEGLGAVRVECSPKWIVVPDYFAGEDHFYGAASLAGRSPYPLPTENLLLGLLDGGRCMLVSVWRSPRQWSEALGGPEGLSGWQVECPEGASLWLAVLQGEGVWGEGTTSHPPEPTFPAQWRAIVAGGFITIDLGSGGRSLSFLSVRGPVVAYPLERTVDTPLSALCVVDVLRAALGMGPCQYVLAAEGMDEEGHPTPASVADWVERQFERGRQVRQATEIRRRLDAMVEHVRRTEQRLESYRALAQAVRIYKGEARLPAGIESQGVMIESALEQYARSGGAERAVQLADRLARLASGGGTFDECRAACAELRSFGSAQEKTLARCRLDARLLLQQCRLAPEEPWAGPVREAVLAVLLPEGSAGRTEEGR